MPPSPRLKATVNAQALTEVCAGLRIRVPSVAIKTGSGYGGSKYTKGEYIPVTHHINLYIDLGTLEADSLRAAQTDLAHTFLHEIRHGWQHFHSPAIWDDVVKRENDANEWAAKNVTQHRNLVRLSRSFPNSGFSRLSRHASRHGV